MNSFRPSTILAKWLNSCFQSVNSADQSGELDHFNIESDISRPFPFPGYSLVRINAPSCPIRFQTKPCHDSHLSFLSFNKHRDTFMAHPFLFSSDSPVCERNIKEASI
ncbi:hypothetical protein H4I96_11732 [Botrytis cinerea]